MKRLLLALLVTFALGLPVSTALPTAIEKVKLATTFIHSDDYFCTTFAVAINRYVTADHCIKPGISVTTLNESKVDVLREDQEHDLALLTINEPRQGLVLGPKPVPGQIVIQAGYGSTPATLMAKWGRPFFYFIPSMVMDLDRMPFVDDSGEMTLYGNGKGGMSGGPIVTEDGKVVSVVTGGGYPNTPLYDIGSGANYEALKKIMKF